MDYKIPGYIETLDIDIDKQSQHLSTVFKSDTIVHTHKVSSLKSAIYPTQSI